ncbi:MAG: hypothetical protein CVU44_22165 [Chloroflexi bacterium HGW-Chloroflexi-6]|nr:MAG: hypothetical protein CVU44_22165 [Chloroflexi bacterium HGW-Chloroflexi-6]
MDLPEQLKTFFEVMDKIKPGIENILTVGTAIGTAGSGLVKILQTGKHWVTLAVGNKKADIPTKKSRKKKPSLPPGLSYHDGQEMVIDKENVAIIVEVSRRAVNDAARYLENNQIDANLIVVTNTGDYTANLKAINEDNPQEWFEMVQEFNMAINAIKNESGSVDLHIFLAVPVTLAFGLGAVWGTVDNATVYHWNGKEYKPVLSISRELRFATNTHL